MLILFYSALFALNGHISYLYPVHSLTCTYKLNIVSMSEQDINSMPKFLSLSHQTEDHSQYNSTKDADVYYFCFIPSTEHYR